jgi:hypothetical protein
VSAEREALFDPRIHLGVRLLAGAVGAGMLLVALRFCWLAVRDRQWLLLAVLPAVIGLLSLVSLAVFRTEKVYGAAEGVQVQRGGVWRTIPWSQVGPPAPVWWSFNPLFRVTELPIPGGPPIRFFSTKARLERLQSLRSAGAP